LNRPISLIFFYLLVTTTHSAENPDLTLETKDGLAIHIHSQVSPIQINQMHSWHVEIKSADSLPVTNASVSIQGGMPEHDHGLPTQPRVIEEIKPGTYLLQGVRFHMPGKWRITISVETESKQTIENLEFIL
jgi:hypothetical protein